MQKLFDLTGKVSIVTGAAGGIGSTLALGMAQFGSDVVLSDVAESAMRTVAAGIKRLGRRALAVRVDITRVSSIDKMMSKALSEFGKIDVLVNNAGCNVRKSAIEVSESDWNKVIDTNLKGAFFCTQAVGRAMLRQRRGKIINIASVMGLAGSPDYQRIVPYCASKGGLVQLTRAFATEWAKYKVNVNAIAPSTVETPLVREMLKDRKRRRRILRWTPMGRLAKPEELVGPVVFLASDASDYMTGQVLCFDGGWLAH